MPAWLDYRLMATSTGAIAALATLVAAAFACAISERWLARRALHDGCWAVSLWLFTVASGAFAWGTSRGWSGTSFRMFYLVGGALNVPWLAAGSLALILGPHTGRRIAYVLAMLSAWATGVIGSSAIRGDVPPDGLPAGRELFGVLPRVIVAVGSGVSATAVIGLAVWSIWRVLRGRTRGQASGHVRHPARLAGGNGLIALGTLILSSSGALSARLGELKSFEVTLAVGVMVLFAGFITAGGSSPPRVRSAKESAKDLATRALW